MAPQTQARAPRRARRLSPAAMGPLLAGEAEGTRGQRLARAHCVTSHLSLLKLLFKHFLFVPQLLEVLNLLDGSLFI